MIAKLNDTEIADALAALSGWERSRDRHAIKKSFLFQGFGEAFGFMTEVAIAAEKADHHPEWSNVWATVDILLATHEAGGITERDINLAREIEAIAARRST